MRRHLLLLAVLLAFGCDKAPSPAAPTPAPAPEAPERIPVFIIGVEPTPVPLNFPAKTTLEMSKPMPDATAWALLRAVSPDGGYNYSYRAEFAPGSTTSTIGIPTIDSHDRAGGYAGLVGEWTLTLEDASFPLQISDPREIKFTVAYRTAEVNISAQSLFRVQAGESFSLNLFLIVPDSPAYDLNELYRDVDIPIETTTPAGGSTVSMVTIPLRESSVPVEVSTTIAGDWTYRILGDRLPEGVILGDIHRVTVTVVP